MAAALRRDGVEARTVAAALSAEIRSMTRRAFELAEKTMLAEGHGAAPVPYAVLVLGSAGRGESLLAADQDNAIIHADADDGPRADAWLARLAEHACRTLDEAGILYCKGGVMAQNEQWRRPVGSWTEQVETWIRRQKPDDLLNVDIFFDAEAVAGDRHLADAVLAHARARARATPSFLKLLTELARQWRSPLGLLGGFQKVDGRVDLKKGGLMPIFTAARVMALRHGIPAASTRDRLEGAKQLGKGAASDFDAVIDAHEVLLGVILDQQIEDAMRGVPLSPRVVVERLDTKGRRRLKTAVEAVGTAVALVSEGRL
jgi:DNA polymerase-3 subunit epsilon/CBS domain-containing protein